jgi:hypothetical protein
MLVDYQGKPIGTPIVGFNNREDYIPYLEYFMDVASGWHHPHRDDTTGIHATPGRPRATSQAQSHSLPWRARWEPQKLELPCEEQFAVQSLDEDYVKNAIYVTQVADFQ